MDIPTILAEFTRQMRQEITYPDMQKEVLPRVMRFTRPAPAMSTVLYSDLNEANADAEIEEQIAFFQVWGGDFAWIHARHGAHLAVPAYLSISVAYVADTPACAGWIYYPPGSEFASL